MHTASAGHLESPVTPVNWITNEAVDTVADSPIARVNGSSIGTAGPTNVSLQPAATANTTSNRSRCMPRAKAEAVPLANGLATAEIRLTSPWCPLTLVHKRPTCAAMKQPAGHVSTDRAHTGERDA